MVPGWWEIENTEFLPLLVTHISGTVLFLLLRPTAQGGRDSATSRPSMRPRTAFLSLPSLPGFREDPTHSWEKTHKMVDT